jgi:hypothetical protein
MQYNTSRQYQLQTTLKTRSSLRHLQQYWKSLKENLAEELEILAEPTPYQEVLKKLTTKEWKKAESNRGLGYSGNSERTKQREGQKARAKAIEDTALQKT